MNGLSKLHAICQGNNRRLHHLLHRPGQLAMAFFQNWRICTISVLLNARNPRNFSPMSAAKGFAHLDLDPIRLFRDEYQNT